MNTIAASATSSYIAANLSHLGGPPLSVVHVVQAQGLLHGYTTVFWWCAAIFIGGAVVCGTLMRRGPLQGAAAPAGQPVPAAAGADAGTTVRSGE